MNQPRRVRVRRLVGVFLVTLVLATGAWKLSGKNEELALRRGSAIEPLPPAMRVETLVESLAARFERADVRVESPAAPVHFGGIRPGHKLGVHSGYRAAIIAPPPSLVRFRVRVPSSAMLRFAVGVERPDGTGAMSAGVHFGVTIDGRDAFQRTLNPGSDASDRRWVDVAIPLREMAGSEVDILLNTATVRTGSGAPGMPGWSHLRLVRETSTARQAPSRDAPSVLLLLVDTLRADRLGCYGARPSPSQVLDRVADDGLVFEQTISQSSWTLPSVATLFTGLNPLSHGMQGGMVDTAGGDRATPADPSYLSVQLTTLAERAQDAGVTTFGASASPLVSRATSLARGFETFVEWAWNTDDRAWPRAASVNATFIDWLRHNSRYRFLAYVHYMDIHDPYDPPASFRPRVPAGVRPAIANGQVSKVVRKIRAGRGHPITVRELDYLRALYDAEIRYWDDQLGRLLDALVKEGVADSTVVMITSDHGEEFEEHGRLKHAVHLYDELIHVPLIVSGPGIHRRRVERQVQGIDIAPTIAALLGVRTPATLPGENLLSSGGQERPAFSETRWGIDPDGSRTTLLSLRTNAWKLIYIPASDTFELYDLVRDPGERINSYGVEPESSRLRGLLAGWRAETPEPPETRGRDPRLTEKLRRLGYVE